MIVPGNRRGSLPRLARLLVGRNRLRRSSDRIEAAIVITLTALFAAAIAAASVIAAHVYHAERADAASLRPVAAVLGHGKPVDFPDGDAEAWATWRAPDGRQRSGMLTTAAAPGIWDAAPAARLQVWVSRDGDPAAPPDQAAMLLDVLFIPVWAAGAAAVTLAICYWLCRLALDRRRLAARESAWALVGPRWTSHR
jgi:hypothetical protein